MPDLADLLSARLGERFRLTGAERAVLAGLLVGQTPVELGRRRGCSPATIRVHIRSIHAKLNISRTTALLPLVISEMESMARSSRPATDEARKGRAPVEQDAL